MSQQKPSISLNQLKKNKKNKKRISLSMRKKRNFRQEVERALINILSDAHVNSNRILPVSCNASYPLQMHFNKNQYIHEIAIWKSRALSLEAENRILRTTIQGMQWACGSRNVPFNVGSASNDNENATSESESISDVANNSETPKSLSDESENEEVDEEFLKFLETSARFRMERDAKKQLESECEPDLTLAPPIVSDKPKRLEELKLLYGDDYLMVMGLETSVQLNYDSYVDKQKPLMWPDVSLTF